MTVKAPILSLQGVTKRYADTDVLGGIDLEVQEGEFVAILGFSGAGKTTLIGAVAGLVEPDGGKILLRGKPIDGPDKERGLVFQSYSLFPWLSVEQNVALAVDAQKAEDAWKQVLDHGGAIVWTATLDDVPDFPGPERTDFWRALGGCLPPNAVADLEMLETFFDPAAITRASARP